MKLTVKEEVYTRTAFWITNVSQQGNRKLKTGEVAEKQIDEI